MNIQKIRETRKMTQQELADLVGVTAPYISMLEKGVRKNPSVGILVKISKALRTTVEVLVTEEKAG